MDTETTLEASLRETTHDLAELIRPQMRFDLTNGLMIAAAVTAFLCAGLLTVPPLVFNQGADDAYTQFSRILADERLSYMPLFPAALCSACALLLPIRRSLHNALARFH